MQISRRGEIPAACFAMKLNLHPRLHLITLGDFNLSPRQSPLPPPSPDSGLVLYLLLMVSLVAHWRWVGTDQLVNSTVDFGLDLCEPWVVYVKGQLWKI